jgi:acylphosphatase
VSDNLHPVTTRRYRITGKVQGVFFRASTRDVATRLGMAGHARNLPDGSVEVLAAGSADAQASLERWLNQGPPSAEVANVTCEAVDGVPPEGFTTG